MPLLPRARLLRLALPLLSTALIACGDSKPADQPATEGTPSSASGGEAARASGEEVAELSAADLDAYAKGLARETELVRAAQERGRAATTPEARGEAQQAQWEDATIPEGAKAAGIDADRYRAVRATVHRTFRWLDFQGKIDGPMSLDTASAPPEMKARLARDPLEDLTPASRAALQGKMSALVPAWIEYVKLTAVAG